MRKHALGPILLALFALSCGPLKHENSIVQVFDKVEKVKTMSLDVFEDWYNYQIVKIVRDINEGTLNADQAREAKRQLDRKANEIRGLLIQAQNLEIALANSLDLIEGGMGTDETQARVQELYTDLLSLTTEIIGRMAEISTSENKPLNPSPSMANTFAPEPRTRDEY